MIQIYKLTINQNKSSQCDKMFVGRAACYTSSRAKEMLILQLFQVLFHIIYTCTIYPKLADLYKHLLVRSLSSIFCHVKSLFMFLYSPLVANILTVSFIIYSKVIASEKNLIIYFSQRLINNIMLFISL